MIGIVAEFDVKEDQVEDFLKTVKPLVEASNNEEGCIKYELQKNIQDECQFAMIEEWKDQAAIDIHNNSEHFTTIVPTLGQLLKNPAKVALYEKVM